MSESLKMIFSAVDFEIEGALKKHRFSREISAPFEVWRNDSRRIVITGIGLTPAAAAFAWACRRFDFDEALNIGTAGATTASNCVFEPFDEDAEFDVLYDGVSENSAAGSDGQTRKSAPLVFARAYGISRVSSIEPYSDRVFNLAERGRTLATSSRPVESLKRRTIAAAKGDLVDMEGYALAFAADVFGKKLSMIKMVSDFSQDCDINANIRKLSRRLANVRGIFS